MISKFDFIVIDDSALDCFIAEKTIQQTGLSKNIKCFTHAADALTYIKTGGSKTPGVIILDVLMPIMDGFEFVKIFEQLPLNIQENYRIIALTSSMNKNDISKILSSQLVKALIDKPITVESINKSLCN